MSGASMPGDVGGRYVMRLGVLAYLLSLAYFFLLDRAIFSSQHFAPIFRALLTVYDARTAWLGLLVCVFAALWTSADPVLRVVDALGRWPVVIAAVATTVFALCAILVYHKYPLSMDEYAAVFQAKVFASGHVIATLPSSVVDWLVVPGFNGPFLLASRVTGQAIETYWPGFALVLAPFEWVGMPWLCNPLLSGIALVLIFKITLTVTNDRRAAGWAVLFALSSGAFVAYGISYYSMQAHLTLNLLFAWLLLSPTSGRAFAAGLAGSLAVILHNPFPHALFAAPWLIAMLWRSGERRLLVPMAAGYLPGLLIGIAWVFLRLDIVPAAHTVASVSGVGQGVFMLPDVDSFNIRAAGLVKMWLWATPSLFLFTVLGYRRSRSQPQVRLLALSAALTLVGYLFVRFDQGHGWGYRYFQSAWGAVPILAACAMAKASGPSRCLVAFAGVSAIAGIVIIVPFQLHQIDGFISQHVAQVPSSKRPGRNIFFIDATGGSYMSDMIQIDPLLRDNDLFLASRSPSLDAELMRQNWPGATKIGQSSWVQQWYLKPELRTGDPSAEHSRWTPSFHP